MIKLTKVHNVKEFTATKTDNRVALEYVNVCPERGYIEATNCHVAIRVPIAKGNQDFPLTPGQGEDPKENMLIPIEQLEKALKLIPKKTHAVFQAVLLTVKGGNEKGVLSVTNGEVSQDIAFYLNDIQYPNLDNVWTSEPPEYEISFSAETLEQICKYVKKIGIANYNRITFGFRGDNKATTFKIKGDDSIENKTIEGLIMPMRPEK